MTSFESVAEQGRPQVAVVDTGICNLASVLAGLRRAGAEPILTHDAATVASASHLMLPGVGAFGPAMESLNQAGLVTALQQRLLAQRPTLAICLGLQILCESSEEAPDVPGLGVIQGRVVRFPGSVRVPQLGWNRVEPEASCAFLRSGYAYYANSYRLLAGPAGWRVATTEHAGQFVAAVERGGILACQFHPELSGAWGLSLMQRWLNGTFQSAGGM